MPEARGDPIRLGGGRAGPGSEEAAEGRAALRGRRFNQVCNSLFLPKSISSADCQIHLCVQTVRIFSLKGMTTKLFGQESQEQRESKQAALEQGIQEGETTVLEKNAECR